MMDLQKRYFDLDGKRRSILEMVNREPEWAANRILEGEKAERKLAVVMRILNESAEYRLSLTAVCELEE